MIKEIFETLNRQGKKALVPYVTAGDPNIEKTYEIIDFFSENGADLIELGVPFSDPLADGPVIQRAMERAIRSGTNLPKIFDLVREFRKKNSTPIILMGYMNPFYSYGFEKMLDEAKMSGVDGILCVDLPFEEAKEFSGFVRKRGLDFIFLVSPLSNENRIRGIMRHATGFLYFVSVTGVTGEKENLPEDIKKVLVSLKSISRMPVALGFGISGASTIDQFWEYVDGFVVGSALIRRLEDVLFDTNSPIFRDFFFELHSACHKMKA